MEYCASVWEPYQQQDIDALERINRRAARVIYNKTWRERGVSPTALLKDLGWDPLSDCRRQHRLSLMYRITHGLVAVPPTRLEKPFRNTTQGLYLSGTILVIALWLHPRSTLLNRDSRSPSSHAHYPSRGSDTRTGFCDVSYTDTDTDTMIWSDWCDSTTWRVHTTSI